MLLWLFSWGNYCLNSGDIFFVFYLDQQQQFRLRNKGEHIHGHDWQRDTGGKTGTEVNYREHRGRRDYQNNTGQTKATDHDKSCHRNLELHYVTIIQMPTMEFGSADRLPGLWAVTRRDPSSFSWLEFYSRTCASFLYSAHSLKKEISLSAAVTPVDKNVKSQEAIFLINLPLQRWPAPTPSSFSSTFIRPRCQLTHVEQLVI